MSDDKSHDDGPGEAADVEGSKGKGHRAPPPEAGGKVTPAGSTGTPETGRQTDPKTDPRNQRR